jgi:hypothetical protein
MIKMQLILQGGTKNGVHLELRFDVNLCLVSFKVKRLPRHVFRVMYNDAILYNSKDIEAFF